VFLYHGLLRKELNFPLAYYSTLQDLESFEIYLKPSSGKEGEEMKKQK
jgi:hypothetical protein